MIKVFLIFVLFILQAKMMTIEQAKTIKVVHLAFSNHLDVGFTAFSKEVVNKYFKNFYPKAVETSKQARDRGYRFIYTTKSWLVSLYLNCPKNLFSCPTEEEVSQFKETVKKGDITWHAFPFNSQAEYMDESLFEFGLDLTHKLDQEFNLPKKMVFGQRDVPGTTRSVIKILERKGIKGMTFGVNGGSAPPIVDPVFEWKDEVSGKSIYVLYHKGGYGSTSLESLPFINGFNRTIAFSYRGDNDGPHNFEQMIKEYENLKKLFPNAEIKGSSFDDYFTELINFKPKLNVITQEIGDTWIYGVPSDPLKNSQFRMMIKERTKCIKITKECNLNDPRIYEFSRHLLKLTEHTWGLDVKENLDFENWSKKDLYRQIEINSKYKRMEESWIDQRKYIDYALESLGNHILRRKIYEAFKRTENPKKPDLTLFNPVNFENTFQLSPELSVKFGSGSGISYLKYKDWIIADNNHKLGYFLFQSFTQLDYDKFFADYCYCPTCYWVPPDFGKPNVTKGNPFHSNTEATIVSLWRNENEFITESHLPLSLQTYYGTPQRIWTKFKFENTSIKIELIWTEKTPSRLPESLWISFNPNVNSQSWRLDKIGQIVSPFEIVKNGSRHQHGIEEGVINKNGPYTIQINSIDAPIVSPMTPTPFPSPLNHLDDKGGMHFNLYNNIWGTNYIMWYPYLKKDENSRFDFEFHFQLK